MSPSSPARRRARRLRQRGGRGRGSWDSSLRALAAAAYGVSCRARAALAALRDHQIAIRPGRPLGPPLTRCLRAIRRSRDPIRSPPWDAAGVEYRQAAMILQRVRATPEGFVRTYGDVCPGAPRVAGAVLSACEDPTVPWHRIVRADGSLAKG